MNNMYICVLYSYGRKSLVLNQILIVLTLYGGNYGYEDYQQRTGYKSKMRLYKVANGVIRKFDIAYIELIILLRLSNTIHYWYNIKKKISQIVYLNGRYFFKNSVSTCKNINNNIDKIIKVMFLQSLQCVNHIYYDCFLNFKI